MADFSFTKISNVFHAIVGRHDVLQSYHAGWPEDIETNIIGPFNEDGDTGRLLPHVQWVFPIDGNAQVNEGFRKYEMDVELWFVDVMDYRTATLIRADSKQIDKVSMRSVKTIIERWDELRNHAQEFIDEFIKRGIADTTSNSVRNFGIIDADKPDALQFETDSHFSKHKFVKLGIKFRVWFQGDCRAVPWDAENLPECFGWPDFDDFDYERCPCSDDVDPIDLS